PLSTFPQTLATDAEFARELRFGHVVLMVQHELDEVSLEAGVAVGLVYRRGGRRGFWELDSEGVRLDRAGVTENDGALQRVFELANVAGPIVARDRVERAVGQREFRFRELVADAPQQSRRKFGDVAAALAQRRDRERRRNQSLVQTGAEASGLYQRC